MVEEQLFREIFDELWAEHMKSNKMLSSNGSPKLAKKRSHKKRTEAAIVIEAEGGMKSKLSPHIVEKIKSSKMRTIEKLLKLYPNEKWDWTMLSKNNDLTASFIKRHGEFKWNWEQLSSNEVVTHELV
jgi:hypothetical protein